MYFIAYSVTSHHHHLAHAHVRCTVYVKSLYRDVSVRLTFSMGKIHAKCYVRRDVTLHITLLLRSCHAHVTLGCLAVQNYVR